MEAALIWLKLSEVFSEKERTLPAFAGFADRAGDVPPAGSDFRRPMLSLVQTEDSPPWQELVPEILISLLFF